MRRIIRTLVVLAIASSLFAQKRSVVFYWENDSIASPFGRGTDNDYTNGLRLAIGTVQEQGWERWLKDRCGTRCNDYVSKSSYAFTHQFYTPTNIQRERPGDRPWAGFMALSANLQLTSERHQHSLEVQGGVLGQGAGAQYVQSKWHQLTSAPTPCCWHHQLKNEPMVNILYGFSRLLRSEHLPYADAIVTPGFALGTLRTYPSMSGTVRAGWHITGFPVPTLEQEAPRALKEDVSEAVTPPRPRTELYLMAGADARYVLHDSTLDGGFFRDGPSVQKIPFVHDYRLGFSGRLDSFRISYNLVLRSPELEHQRGFNFNHNYHSLMIGIEPP